ncbi:UpxY family transcription antiterminator [bacterium]|nr:UpxY family transcription antiterminator [bacterium]
MNQCFLDPNWYALYVIVRHEKKVQSALLRKNVQNYLPLKESLQWWKDRRKRVLFPLFPGYLFVRIALAEKLSVLNTAGVVRLVGTGDAPSPVSTDQIDAIKRLIENSVPLEEEIYSGIGRRVVVRRGPLRNIEGRILEIRGNCRLILSIDIIQRSVSAEVNLNDVEMI